MKEQTWNSYKETVFVVSEAVRDRLDAEPAFAIISAQDPHSSGDRAADAPRTVELRERLDALGVEAVPVTGYSPDLSHSEKSFAAALTLEKAVELGRAFRQNAVFWVEAGTLHLVSCVDERAPEPVAEWQERRNLASRMLGRLDVKAPYPYVVIRWMAAVYGRAEVVFTTELRPDNQVPGLVVVPDPSPGADALTDARLDALLAVVLDRVQSRGFRMCVVLGPDKVLFVERDGRIHPDVTPPSGGIRLDEVVTKDSKRERV